MYIFSKFNLLGPFVIANSSSSENENSTESLEDLDPLAIHHNTLSAAIILVNEGAPNLASGLLETYL